MSTYSPALAGKIETLKKRRRPVSLGRVRADSPLVLAPMSAICQAPFRLLMRELGAGMTVSELISCHGINHGNRRTLDMLRIDPAEGNTGIQLFGEDGQAMARAALKAHEVCGERAAFIDINMGCPVRKVVTKGGGAALLRQPAKLPGFIRTIKRHLPIPLGLKIRTGWDEAHINANEILQIAAGEGVEFVAIHGRSRAALYRGRADWNLLEQLARQARLPVLGNGDLHSALEVRNRLGRTRCRALMLGRGPLREPFLFLTSLLEPGEVDPFGPSDYLEVLERYHWLLERYHSSEHIILTQARKMALWLAAGFPRATDFRRQIFESGADPLKLAREYFAKLAGQGEGKNLNQSRPFMMGGHG